MEFKDKIKQLRISKKLHQEDLALKLGVNQKQISAYEMGSNMPSTETLIKIAEIFDISLDYLVFDKKTGSTALETKDRDFLKLFEEADKLDEEKKAIIKKFISLLINEDKIKKMIN